VKKNQTKLSVTSALNIIDDPAIWTRIQAAWWLGKEGIALHKFNSLVETHLYNRGLAAPTAYRDDKSAWDMLDLIARYFRRLLKDRITASPFYGIMVDETTDVTASQQLIIYIKFLDYETDGTLVSKVEYLDLVSPKSGTAEDLKVISPFLLI